MNFRSISFVIGIFSITMGIISYNSEVSTAKLPIILGVIVLFMAVFNLIPELKRCSSCYKRILKKAEHCRHCGKKQPPQEDDTP